MNYSLFKKTVSTLISSFLLVSCHPNNNTSDSNKHTSTNHSSNNNCVVSFYCDGKYLGQSTTITNYIIGPDYNYLSVAKQYSGSFFAGWYLDSDLTNRVENYVITSEQLSLYSKLVSPKDAILTYIKKKETIDVVGPSTLGSAGNIHYNPITDEIYADCSFSAYNMQIKLSNGYSTFTYALSEDVFDMSTNSILPAGTVLASGEFDAAVSYITPQRRVFGGIQIEINNLQYVYYYSQSFVSSNIADSFEGIFNNTFDDFVPTSYNFGKETGLFLIE